jgi:hypothetical protein
MIRQQASGSGGRERSHAMESHAAPPRNQTVVAEPTWVFVLMWAGFPLLGAAAGWLILRAAVWVADFPWVPFRGPFELVATISGHPLGTVGVLVAGVIAGLVLAYLGAQDSLSVTVSDDRVALTRAGSSREIERRGVSAVFVDGKQLVLLGRSTEELAREKSDMPADRLEAAFRTHAYPWQHAGDPYQQEFRRWVEDTPDLPTGANAVFKARQRALDKGDGEDVADLRTELAKLGIVVRDEKKRQYWRRAQER